MNDGEVPTSANAPDLFLWDSAKHTNWENVAFGGTAKLTNLQTAISGGTSNVQYRMGGNFQNETTVFPVNFQNEENFCFFQYQ